MNNLHLPPEILVPAWGVFLWQLTRSYRFKKLDTLQGQAMWLACGIGLVLMTLSGQPIEQAIDQWIGGLGLAFHLKFLAALLTVHIFYRGTPRTRISSLAQRPFLNWLCPCIALISLTTVFFQKDLGTDTQAILRYNLLALRDCLVVFFIAVIFIPSALNLWRDEKILAMKRKHFSALCFDRAYLLLAVGNILTAAASFYSLSLAQHVDRAFQPAMSLCGFFFFLTLLPNRWWDALLVFERFIWLHRLNRLAMQLGNISGYAAPGWHWRAIDQHLYWTMIFILDHYPALQTVDPDLYKSIAHTVNTSPDDYTQLIQDFLRFT